MTDFRNRIIGLEYVDTADLLPHPENWRVHSQAQGNALLGILADVGIADALLVYHSEKYAHPSVVIDGNLRTTKAPQKWPVLRLDVSDEEAAYILVTHDPLAALAKADAEKLDALLRDVQSGAAAVQAMLADVAAKAGLYSVDVMAEWEGMPEFVPEDAFGAVKSLTVHFPTWEDYDRFVALVEQPAMTQATRNIWFPPKERVDRTGMVFIDDDAADA